jgi:hypothetical protein
MKGRVEEEVFRRNRRISSSLFLLRIDDVFVKRAAILKAGQLHNFRDGVFFGDIQRPGAFELAWANRADRFGPASLSAACASSLQSSQGAFLDDITLVNFRSGLL